MRVFPRWSVNDKSIYKMTICASKIVDKQWNHVLDELVSDGSPYVTICKEAKQDTKLGKLFPFVGIAGFCFSTVCEYPFFVDVLISHIDDDRFGVYVASGDGGWAETDLVGEGDSTTCVSMASDVLPDDYGGAILGGANEWRKAKGFPLVESAYD
jgi:hypothetical protein